MFSVVSQKLSTSHPTLTSSCVALSPSAAAEEACVDEAFFDDEALWLRRSGRAEAAVVEEKRLRLRIFFFTLEEVEKKLLLSSSRTGIPSQMLLGPLLFSVQRTWARRGEYSPCAPRGGRTTRPVQ